MSGDNFPFIVLFLTKLSCDLNIFMSNLFVSIYEEKNLTTCDHVIHYKRKVSSLHTL